VSVVSLLFILHYASWVDANGMWMLAMHGGSFAVPDWLWSRRLVAQTEKCSDAPESADG